MKNRKIFRTGLIIVLCLCLLGGGYALAASGQVEIWATALQYELEITEPVLEELPDGQGRFRARAACSEGVTGESVSIVVAFYDGDGRQLDCWLGSHTLAAENELIVEGTLPDYAKVGVYFFESESFTPIRPSVMRLLDGQVQITSAQLSEVKTELLQRIEELEEKTSSLWAGKSVVFVGDSISAGTGTTKTYCEYLEESMGFGKVTVMGVPGSCMSTTSDYGTGRSPLINRWENIPDADLIVVFMGTNDYGHETPLGSISDSGDVSFYGALNTIVPGIISAHPDSRVVFMTPLHRYGAGSSALLGEKFTYDYLPNGRGHSLDDYVEAIKAVCERWSVPVIDLYAESGIHPAIADQKADYMPDGIHPNAAGHEKISCYIANCLELYGSSEKAREDETPQAPADPADTVLRYGNKFVTDSFSTNRQRASSATNLWLTVGQTVTLLDTESYTWALAGTDSAESSAKTHGYYPEAQWSSVASYTVQKEGWYGVTILRTDGGEFDFSAGGDSDRLFDYISIE